jgi:hypothetical protein
LSYLSIFSSAAGNPWLPPGTICTFFAQGLRVADLGAGFDPERWPRLWADFAVDWRAEWFGKSIVSARPSRVDENASRVKDRVHVRNDAGGEFPE